MDHIPTVAILAQWPCSCSAVNLSCSLQDRQVREDLRELSVCSVDPPGCTDIDDALHCRDLPNGNLEVGHSCMDIHTHTRTALYRCGS